MDKTFNVENLIALALKGKEFLMYNNSEDFSSLLVSIAIGRGKEKSGLFAKY